LIALSHVEKSFRRRSRSEGAVQACKGISFECQPGKITCLLGPNGSGKTTLLRMVAGLMRPDAGRIVVDGHDVLEAPMAVKRSIGFLTAGTSLYGKLTPWEMLHYFGRLHGMGRQALRRRCDILLERLGIDAYARRRIQGLSVGMRQKVSLARALLHDPPVLVFDEPTAGLDILASRTVMDILREARKEGKTILFSTHVMGEVQLLADGLVIIHEGRRCFAGSLEEFEQGREGKHAEEAFLAVLEQMEGGQ